MGLMDKVKAQAEHALAVGKVAAEKGVELGKEGLAQSEAKVKEMRDKRAAADSAAADSASDDEPEAPAGD